MQFGEKEAMTKPMSDERYKALREFADSPWEAYTAHTSQLREAMDEVGRLREENERMSRDGKLRRCDIPACNCGGFHSGYAQRMMEIADERDELRETIAEALLWYGGFTRENPFPRIRVLLDEEEK